MWRGHAPLQNQALAIRSAAIDDAPCMATQAATSLIQNGLLATPDPLHRFRAAAAPNPARRRCDPDRIARCAQPLLCRGPESTAARGTGEKRVEPAGPAAHLGRTPERMVDEGEVARPAPLPRPGRRHAGAWRSASRVFATAPPAAGLQDDGQFLKSVAAARKNGSALAARMPSATRPAQVATCWRWNASRVSR
jgi:hypothetical protein